MLWRLAIILVYSSVGALKIYIYLPPIKAIPTIDSGLTLYLALDNNMTASFYASHLVG